MKIALYLLLITNVVFTQESVLVKVEDIFGSALSGVSVKVRETDTSCTTDLEGKCFLQIDTKRKHSILTKLNGFADEKIEIQNAKQVRIIMKPVVAYVSVVSGYLAGKDEALSSVPGSLQVISKDELENSGFFTISEALRRVTGVYVREEEGFSLRPNISIRGTNPTRSTKVLLLEDGVPLTFAPYGDNASYYHPPIERFESVEVLKGSGQILYGPTTVAGVINYITPNPPEKRQFSLKLIGGSRDIFDGSFSYGESFGKSGLILNFTRKQGQGARDNVRIGLNDINSKFSHQLNILNYLTLKFSYLKEDSRVTYSGLTESEYSSNPRQNPFRNDSFNAFRTGTSFQYTSIINNLASLNTVAYLSYFSRDWWRQSSNSNERPNRLGSDPDCRGMQDLYTTCGNQGRLRDYLTFGVEPRLSLTFSLSNVKNEFNFGFRIHSEKQDRLQKNGDLPTSRDGVTVENNLRKNLAFAGFIQHRLTWKNVALTPGIRIENIKYHRTNRLNGLSGETRITEAIPGFGFTANFFGNTTIFAGIHRGFAPPRTEDIISNTGGVVDLESEKSWNYELGVRTRPLEYIRAEVTIFKTDYENQIVPASVAGGIGATLTNSGKTLHQGVELLARFDSAKLFNTPFNLYLQIAHTELEKAEFRGRRFSSINPNILVTGKRLPYSPRRLSDVILGLSYRNLDGFIEGNYISRQFSDDLNRINPTPSGQQGIIPAQTYLNTTINYRLEKWKTVLFFTAKNLLNRTFIVDRSRGILPSMPRLLQVGFKRNF